MDDRCRRTVRDYERLPGHHETIVYGAMTITMTAGSPGRAERAATERAAGYVGPR